MNRPRDALLVAVLGIVGSVNALAATAQDSPEASVRATATAYLNALAKGDAAAIASFWTDDGTYVDVEGKTFRGRELASKEFADRAPPNEATEIPAIASEINFVGPTTAIETGCVQSNESASTPSDAAPSFVAVWTRVDQNWKLSLLRELRGASSPAKSAAAPEALAELDWMTGRWEAKKDGASVTLTARWTAERKFLLLRFVARRGQETIKAGTQRLGWDARAKQIRSWTFSDDGGFSESQWRKQGDVWVVDVAGELADGRPTTSVHLWTHEGDVSWFKSVQAEADGKPAEDLVLKFVRTEEAP